MKTLMFALAFLSFVGKALAQEKGIKFEKGLSWTQVKDKARKENKFIFIEVYATWCGPCKEMDKNVYPSEKLGLLMNDHFISIKVQVDQTNGDNKIIKDWYKDAAQIIKDYSINGYPTHLFFSPKAELVNKSIGWLDEYGLIKIASQSLDSVKILSEKLQKYREGKLKNSEKSALAILAKSVGQNKVAQLVADDYIDNFLFKLKDNELFKLDHLKFISDFLGSPSSRSFKLFWKHPERVNRVLGEHSAQNKVMEVIDKNFLPQFETWNSNIKNWDSLEKVVTKKFDTLGQERVFGQRLLYHLYVKDDWRSYGIYYMKYFQRALKRPRFEVNTMSWLVFENVTDPEILKFACDVVMKYGIEEWFQNDPAAYDTYANLLYKSGRDQEGIKWEQRAVNLSNQEKVFVETLKKMKNGLQTWPSPVKN